MDYYLYKLRFDGAVHFGLSDSALSLYTSADHFCADTLFSALCHTALALWGQEGIKALVSQVQAGELLLSDSMPWRSCSQEDVYYLPKPCAISLNKKAVPSSLRKAVKKLAWIPVEHMDVFGDSLNGVGTYEPPVHTAFGVARERTLAAVPYEQDARPYQVGAFHFFKGCGLYFIAACGTKTQAERYEKLVEALGMGGIGGKVSAGFGTFCIENIIYLNESSDAQLRWLYDGLTAKHPQHYLLLTTSLPGDDELDSVLADAQYQLVRRGGFVQSDTFGDTPLKKQTQYYLAAGAILDEPFQGALYDVAAYGRHPVYRYAKPILLGVSF